MHDTLNSYLHSYTFMGLLSVYLVSRCLHTRFYGLRALQRNHAHLFVLVAFTLDCYGLRALQRDHAHLFALVVLKLFVLNFFAVLSHVIPSIFRFVDLLDKFHVFVYFGSDFVTLTSAVLNKICVNVVPFFLTQFTIPLLVECVYLNFYH